MSNNNTEQASEALLVLQGQLDGLLQWLEPAAVEGHDPANLDSLLDSALSQADDAKLDGVSELLRIWSAAMNHRARVNARLSDNEKAHLHSWFSGLYAYCMGNLDIVGQQDLLDQLATMPKLVMPPPRLYAFLQERLAKTEAYIQQLVTDNEQFFVAEQATNSDASIATETDAFVTPDHNAFIAVGTNAFVTLDHNAFIAVETDAFVTLDHNAFIAAETDAFVEVR